MNLRYGLSRYGNVTEGRPREFSLSSLGFPQALEAQVVRQSFPVIQISGMQTVGRTGDAEDFSDVHTLQANMTRIGSRHAMKYGLKRASTGTWATAWATAWATHRASIRSMRPGRAGPTRSATW